MQSLIRKLARELRGSLPFAVVNPNPKNLLGKLLSYKTVQDANNDGFAKTFNETSFVGSNPSKKGKNIFSDRGSKKSVIVDLDNYKYIWDFDAFNRYIKGTSWYSELGNPPKRGLFIIDTVRLSIQWLNRDSDNLEVYMDIQGGANNILKISSGSSITDFEFLDGKIFISIDNGDGVIVIDLLNDEAYSYYTTGFYRSSVDLSSRNNGTNTNGLLSSTTSIVNDTVNCISCLRSSTIEEDSFGRPHHYWVAGTAGGLSVFVPNINDGVGNGNIYDSTITDSIDFIELANDGTFLVQCFIAGAPGKEVWYHYPSVDSIKSDSFTEKFNAAYDGIDSNKMPLTSAADSKSIGIYYDDDLVALYGTDEGLVSHYIRNPIVSSGSNFTNAKTLTTSTFLSPYMMDDLIAAWPLNDLNDRSGNGYTLSNLNGVTFSTTDAPFGGKAVFTGVTDRYLTNTTFSMDLNLDWTIVFCCKTNGSGTTTRVGPIGINAGSTRIVEWREFVTGPGQTGELYVTPNNASTAASCYTYEIDTSWPWTQIALQRDNTAGTYKAFVNGVFNNEVSVTTGGADVLPSPDTINIGQLYSGDTNWNGSVSNVSVYQRALTEEELQKDYQRMRIGLSSSSKLLTSNTVNNIGIDQDSGVGIIITGTTVHIMNMKTGLIQETKTLSSAANHVDIVSINKGSLPHYVISGDNYIELVSSDNKL